MINIDDLADALRLEPRDVFDPAIMGVAERAGGLMVIAYDAEKCIEAILGWLECDGAEAHEYFEYNVLGSWEGDGTPIFVTKQPL